MGTSVPTYLRGCRDFSVTPVDMKWWRSSLFLTTSLGKITLLGKKLILPSRVVRNRTLHHFKFKGWQKNVEYGQNVLKKKVCPTYSSKKVKHYQNAAGQLWLTHRQLPLAEWHTQHHIKTMPATYIQAHKYISILKGSSQQCDSSYVTIYAIHDYIAVASGMAKHQNIIQQLYIHIHIHTHGQTGDQTSKTCNIIAQTLIWSTTLIKLYLHLSTHLIISMVS